MCLETIYSLRPVVLKRVMEFYSQSLQLHSRYKTIRRSQSASDHFVDLLFEVDERRFHGEPTLIQPTGRRKARFGRVFLPSRI